MITRLVVGGPQTLALGRAVGQRLGTPSSGALRWRAGRWVGPGAPRIQWLDRVLARRQPNAIVVRSTGPSTKFGVERRPLLAGVVAAISLGAAIPLAFVALRTESSTTDGLPVAPAAAIGTVHVVAGAYVPPPTQGPAETPPLPSATADGAAAPSLPFAPPTAGQQLARDLPNEAPPAAPEKTLTAATKPGPAVQKDSPANAKAPNQREQQPVSAVVIDEASPLIPRGQADSTVAAGPSAEPEKMSSSAAMASTQPAQAKAPLQRGIGLIAITPDAKVAVFTNPKTRLPQQFKTGDQLPSGDTIRTIDAKEGKVVSSTKEYTLD